MSDLENRLAALEGRLQAAEDRLAILDLEGRYVKAFDSRDGEAWAALFTPGGVYQARGATPDQGMYYQGREQLSQMCREAPFHGMHLINLPEITVTGDTAIGRLHFQFFTAGGGEQPAKSLVGYYDAEYRRLDGAWFFHRRVTSVFKRTEVSDGPYPLGSGLA